LVCGRTTRRPSSVAWVSPFVITMALMIVILSLWPQLALWLPRAAN
jgi:TRAP-type C4-dicarboxylate transport system permease large subunit